MSRMTALAARLLPVIGLPVLGVALVAGCGSPPQPLPTAPPPQFGSPGAVPSGSAGVPTFSPPAGLPTGVPTAGYPTYQNPAYPTYPATTRSSSPPPTGPPPAPKCTDGPTGAQILAVIKGKPGIPTNAQLVLKGGPYCAGSWQFATVGEAGDFDPLQVVTSGKPTALKLEEAGADVCSDHVQSAAPVGIRVWACGS